MEGGVAARIGASKMGLFEKRPDSVVGDLAGETAASSEKQSDEDTQPQT